MKLKNPIGSLGNLRVPRFRSQYRVESHGEEILLFSCGEDSIAVKGRLFVALAPHINGLNSVDEICRTLQETLLPGSVKFGLYCLMEKGLIVDAALGKRDSLPRGWELLELDGEGLQAGLEAWTISVDGGPASAVEGMKAVLEKLALPLADRGSLQVIVTEDYLSERNRELQQDLLNRGSAWMLVKPTGRSVWWGPLFGAGVSGCWNCLRERMQQNRCRDTLSAKSEVSLIRAPDTEVRLEALANAGLRLAALSLLRWIADPAECQLENRIYRLDGRSMTLTEHIVSRLEHCPACGPKERIKTKPIPIGYEDDPASTEDLREVTSPGELFEVLRHNVSPISGIVSSVKPCSTPRTCPVHVYVANMPTPQLGEATLSAWCAGRGADPVAARTAALCEAIERYSGIFRGNEERLVGSYKELKPVALLPNSLMCYGERQYQNSVPVGKGASSKTRPPERLEEECKVEWTPVWSLKRREYRLVPTAYCYYGYPEGEGSRFCKADSNGNAAGCSVEDAIVRGFLELVERDAVALWWYNRIYREALILESLDIAWLPPFVGYYQSIGRRVVVMDLTTDLGIPTCVAVSRGNRGNLDDLSLGFGSSFSLSGAAASAILEMNQLLPAILAGRSTCDYTGLRQLTEEDLGWLWPQDSARFSCPPSERKDEVTNVGNLGRCLEVAAEHGLEVLYLDQTRPETGLSVVKVFVPTLRPWWPRFGPGRLYDIPVTMGWLKRATREEELNPAELTL